MNIYATHIMTTEVYDDTIVETRRIDKGKFRSFVKGGDFDGFIMSHHSIEQAMHQHEQLVECLYHERNPSDYVNPDQIIQDAA